MRYVPSLRDSSLESPVLLLDALVLTVPQTGKPEKSYGLHKVCYASTGLCVSFPQTEEDCQDDKWGFCSMWRTVGFLMSLAVVVELCTLVAFVVIIAGGVQRRSVGWQLQCSLLLFSSIIQCVGMALVVRPGRGSLVPRLLREGASPT